MIETCVGHFDYPQDDSESFCYNRTHIGKRLLYECLSAKTYQEESLRNLRFLDGFLLGSLRISKHIEWGTFWDSVKYAVAHCEACKIL